MAKPSATGPLPNRFGNRAMLTRIEKLEILASGEIPRYLGTREGGGDGGYPRAPASGSQNFTTMSVCMRTRSEFATDGPQRMSSFSGSPR